MMKPTDENRPEPQRRLGALLVALCALAAAMTMGAGGMVEVGPGNATAPPPPDYIQSHPGQLPLILAAPHGGQLRPAAIPDRQLAVLVNDGNSRELTLELAQALSDVTGGSPFVVINQLHRSKLDPNRSLSQGAQANPAAEAAWRQYHQAIEQAKTAIAEACARGLYLEIHSHGQPNRWIEIGYGLDAAALDRPDDELDRPQYRVQSNIRGLVESSDQPLSALVRGQDSLGGLLQAAGYRALPSPARPTPSTGYFDGGYGVYTHGSRHGGAFDAIQLEVSYDLLEPVRRGAFVDALAHSLIDLLAEYYGAPATSSAESACMD